MTSAPLRLPPDLQLTPEQFERVCAENREAVLELDAQGHLISITPASSETSGRNSELLYQLQRYARSSGGWKVFESSAGFRLPDGSVLSPEKQPRLCAPLPRPGGGAGQPRRREQATALEAGAEFPGLQLNLAEIWAG
jgi:Uma2 family endonuclease